MTGLADATVAITGGGSGIGAACADAFRAAGANIGILDIQPPEVDDDRTHAVVADVADQAGLDEALGSVAARFGGVDILINNAGISAVGGVGANDDDEWHRVLDVNIVGMARAAKAALPHLRRSSRASIVNVSSIAATAGVPQRVLYSASKGAVHGFTLAMAADLIGEGIRVNCVAPGTVDTPWVGRLLAQADDPEAQRAQLQARQPTGRLVAADEVARAIVYLADPENGATTGISLAVDGGMGGLRLPR